ncbi:hypothetical protein BU24DRAFT_403916 [Aaosphaeria arxii CBS 175.79]|uniref:Uncharacterized protein n=1 Tax=Aaosphaeria arxii CBS 175.79 TaxID=1450172 RepID=A0A6A5Y743_9PLEO|nr:uncharacterized protein BU24DRAFT_403916 [Aaosphaeria arxii CBS 175.79]KAF2020847.1 hypothetical protein BU24DRAFT_403916 [Aaosphaeria arxii CBS 175.79]
MLVTAKYVREHLPLRCYRGLLRACHQTYREVKQAIQHMHASKQLNYELSIAFSHGRPFFSLTWLRFPALSSVINNLVINVDLRLREPFSEAGTTPSMPADSDLLSLLEDNDLGFASHVFDYLAVLLKTLADLMFYRDPDSAVLYVEAVTLNLTRPTQMVSSIHGTDVRSRRVLVDREEAHGLDETMRTTLRTNVQGFGAFDASKCNTLTPLIQIGTLRFASDCTVWGKGHNLVIADKNFAWLKYAEP